MSFLNSYHSVHDKFDLNIFFKSNYLMNKSIFQPPNHLLPKKLISFKAVKTFFHLITKHTAKE